MLLFLWIERTPLPGVPEGIQLFLDYLMSKINKLSSVDQVQNLMNPVCESQIKIYFDCSIECQPALVTPAPMATGNTSTSFSPFQCVRYGSYDDDDGGRKRQGALSGGAQVTSAKRRTIIHRMSCTLALNWGFVLIKVRKTDKVKLIVRNFSKR